MNAMMDILLAFIIGGMLILSAMRMDINVKSHAIRRRHDLSAQENIHVMADMLEYDIRKIGHALPISQLPIIAADSNSITFQYYMVSKSNINDTTKYQIQYKTLPAQETENPNDLALQRIVNGNQDGGGSLGLIRLNFEYRNHHYQLLPTPVCADSLRSIRQILITMQAQSRYSYNNEYANASFVTRILPKNLLDHRGL